MKNKRDRQEIDEREKVSEGADFKKLLKQIQLPYNFKTPAQLNKDIPAEVALYKEYHKQMGTKKAFYSTSKRKEK